MSVLVTGGAGFIGSNYILSLLRGDGECIVTFDKLTYAGNLQNLGAAIDDKRHFFVHGDIGDKNAVRTVLNRYRPRAVIHFAAESHVDKSISAPDAFIETNIVGHFALLETVREYWNGLDATAKTDFRFLHISTDEVYGSLDPDAAGFSEDHPYRPNSPYSASKAASDHLVRACHHTYGLPTLTVNCSNNYGPRQFPEKLIPRMITDAIAGRDLPIYGDGKNIRDWLYVGDHCEGIAAVLANGRPGETYNIGGGQEKTNIEVVDAICRELDRHCPRADGQTYAAQIRFVADRPGHDRRYAVDFTKIRSELGWSPKTDFARGIAETVAWYLAHPQWIEDIRSGAYRNSDLVENAEKRPA